MIAAEFWQLCNNHDWYYEFSDDRRMWRRGHEQRNRINALAAGNPEFMAIRDGFQAHAFSGEPWGTARAPKPRYPGVKTFEGDTPSVHPNQLELSIS